VADGKEKQKKAVKRIRKAVRKAVSKGVTELEISRTAYNLCFSVNLPGSVRGSRSTAQRLRIRQLGLTDFDGLFRPVSGTSGRSRNRTPASIRVAWPDKVDAQALRKT
jgi:hypothetical protein